VVLRSGAGYNILIDACGKAQQLLTQMQREGVQPNAHTFTTIINACRYSSR